MSGAERRRARPALLALADGTVFRGSAFGADGEVGGEVVFNTAMTGYQEILTDPSYHGQMVAMTYPEIGNVGVNREDVESRAALRQRLHRQGVLGSAEQLARRAEPRRLHARPRHRRHRRASTRARWSATSATHGAQEAIISTVDLDADRLVARAKARPGLVGRDLVREVTLSRGLRLDRAALAARGSEHRRGRRSAAGRPVRRRLRLRHQAQHPAQPRERGLPRPRRAGDDAGRGRAGAEARRRLPLQRSRRSRRGAVRARERRRSDRQGADLRHLPRPPDPRPRARRQHLQAQVRPPRRQPPGDGHRPPARSRSPRRTTASRSTSTRSPGKATLTHLNLNDRTVEGLTHTKEPLFSVQYHPEASPGPHDSRYLFRRFVDLIERTKG